MVFYWSLRDRKSHHVSSTLLSILADFNNPVVEMLSTQFPISNSSSLFVKPLGIVPSAPVTIGITVTCKIQSFFNSLARFKYSHLFSFSLIFLSVVSQDIKIHNYCETTKKVLFCCLLLWFSGLVLVIYYYFIIVFIIVIRWFSALHWVSYNHSPSIYPRTKVRENRGYMYFIYFCFLLPLFYVTFFSYWCYSLKEMSSSTKKIFL